MDTSVRTHQGHDEWVEHARKLEEVVIWLHKALSESNLHLVRQTFGVCISVKLFLPPSTLML